MHKGLVKSNSTYAGTSDNLSNFSSRDNHQNKTSSSSYSESFCKVELQKQQFENVTSNTDLENIPEDDSYKPLSTKWWSVGQDGDVKSLVNDETDAENILIDIQISSCNL